jgi:AcrR family transcriptional regulator
MESAEISEPKPGLRERKKRQTRDTIERVALRLFVERGYDETTLADIAEAANVAPRTIFAYFHGKEDILLCGETSMFDRLKELLDTRPAGATTIDALREFMALVPPPDDTTRVRKQVILANPGLQVKARGHFGELEALLTASIAKDLDAGPDDIRPTLVAASMTAAFKTVRDRLEAADDEPSHSQVLQILDEVLEFLRGGLEALQRS